MQPKINVIKSQKRWVCVHVCDSCPQLTHDGARVCPPPRGLSLQPRPGEATGQLACESVLGCLDPGPTQAPEQMTGSFGQGDEGQTLQKLPQHGGDPGPEWAVPSAVRCAGSGWPGSASNYPLQSQASQLINAFLSFPK